MNFRRAALRLLTYAWVAPNTLLGALLGLFILCLLGRVQFVQGVAEFHGGLLGRIFAKLPVIGHFGAVTLGHVILGRNPTELALLRAHESVHVRQYERWGVFFLPAYALSSVWEVIHGRGCYKSNYFERQAYGTAESGKNAA